jgi:hypothetical protein
MDELDKFFTKTPEVVIKPKKKRKHSELKKVDTDTDDLKNRARFYCKSPDQWLIVKKYNRDRLDQFVSEHDFNALKDLHESLFGFIHKVLAVVCDKISAGGGHVQEQILSDVTLRQSIEQEGGSFIQFLTNRYKIVALTCVDTFNGKQKEISLRPQILIEEEKNDEHSQTSEQLAPTTADKDAKA